jgi:hypothetical protein
MAPALSIVADRWDDYVGISRAAGRLRVSLPKVYERHIATLSRDSHQTLAHAILLIRVLSQYRHDVLSAAGRARVASGFPVAEFEGSSALLHELDAAVRIRDDFLKNGFYFVKRNESTLGAGPGPIDWARTTALVQPLLQDDQIVFPSLMHRRRLHDSDNFIHRLHATVVREVLELFGESAATPEASSLDESQYAEVRKNPQFYLDSPHDSAFSDRAIEILSLLRAYLGTGVSPSRLSGEQAEYCVTKSFELIWEQMLRALLENYSLTGDRRLPRGKWTHSGGGSHPDIGPRVDIVRHGKRQESGLYDYLALFDAKDKRAKEVGRSATEADHYKQIIYAQLLDLSESNCFANILIFPRLDMDESKKASFFYYSGRHEWTGLQRSRVHEASADYGRLSRWYVRSGFLDAAKEAATLVKHCCESN